MPGAPPFGTVINHTGRRGSFLGAFHKSAGSVNGMVSQILTIKREGGGKNQILRQSTFRGGDDLFKCLSICKIFWLQTG
jgi:hypothetical protein